jgi:hypothetical protein
MREIAMPQEVIERVRPAMRLYVDSLLSSTADSRLPKLAGGARVSVAMIQSLGHRVQESRKEVRNDRGAAATSSWLLRIDDAEQFDRDLIGFQDGNFGEVAGGGKRDCFPAVYLALVKQSHAVWCVANDRTANISRSLNELQLTRFSPHLVGRKEQAPGWGGRIRTSVWRNQNPLPYHLATPQGSLEVIWKDFSLQ